MATPLETVTSFYKNILGREGSSSEIAYWVGRIDSGVETVADVVSAFALSAEAATQVAPIVNLYFTAFGRVPDAAGLQYWVNAQQNGLSLGNIAQAFTQSQEFAQTVNADNTAFVTALYQHALGRTPDADGLSYWAAQLASGLSRDQLLTSISSSQESQTTTGVKTQIVLTYNGLLGRSPSEAEVQSIVQNPAGKSPIELIKETANHLIASGGTSPTPPSNPTTPTEAIFTPHEGSTFGSSDASGAVAWGDKYMIVGDDESNVLRVYDRAGGDALVEWDYSQVTGSTDEVDMEALTLVGDTLYITGSHSNTKKGVDADSREILFSVKVSGTGAATTFDYQGKFTGFEAALVAWDNGGANGHPAGYFGFAASSGPGLAPENTNGFSIEGMTTSIDNSELWLGFRAPQTDTTTRDKALIVPVTNYQAVLADSSMSVAPTFGTAIELNLGGRGIRSIDKAADGSGYLIIAGPSGVATDAVTNDFRLYTWNGKPEDPPVKLNNNLDALLKATGGSFESIVSPASIKPGTQIQLLQDNGDTLWPDQTEVSKDLKPADQQFKGNVITLGSPVEDHTAPSLVAASPANNSEGLPIGSSLTLTFDEGVAFGTGAIELQDANGATVQRFKAGDAGVKVDYNAIILQPTVKLKPDTPYKLVIDDHAVTDHSDNALAGSSIGFTTGDAPHYSILISEVNSNAKGGDFFELYNYGTAAIDLSGWKMNDEAGSFSSAVALPSGLSLAAGQTLVVLSNGDDVAKFKTAWGLSDNANVISISGPGLGKEDAVIVFDANGNVATAFDYDADPVLASDGSVLAIQAPATNHDFKDGEHAGAAYGSTATASAVWDGVSVSDPHYIGAVAGQYGSITPVANPTSIGSPGYVPIVQSGALNVHTETLAG
jgi:methionine-rich copper-binding protein CopC